MIDGLNDELVVRGERPIAFDNDCREGICGACSMTIDGRPHGPGAGTTTCQIYMRQFEDGATITVEPFNARAFPVIRDLIVDRSALDRISRPAATRASTPAPSPSRTRTRSAPRTPSRRSTPRSASAAAHAWRRARTAPRCCSPAPRSPISAISAGTAGPFTRVQDMVEQMDAEGFGGCTNFGECEAACPKEISIRVIGQLNRDYLLGVLYHPRNPRGGMKPQ